MICFTCRIAQPCSFISQVHVIGSAWVLQAKASTASLWPRHQRQTIAMRWPRWKQDWRRTKMCSEGTEWWENCWYIQIISLAYCLLNIWFISVIDNIFHWGEQVTITLCYSLPDCKFKSFNVFVLLDLFFSLNVKLFGLFFAQFVK